MAAHLVKDESIEEDTLGERVGSASFLTRAALRGADPVFRIYGNRYRQACDRASIQGID